MLRCVAYSNGPSRICREMNMQTYFKIRYGRALLVQLAKIARERCCGRMEWAVLNWNDPAIQFYRKLGAKPMDEWTVFRLTRDEIARLAETEQVEQEQE